MTFAFLILFPQFFESLSYQVLRQRTFLLLEHKKLQIEKFADKLHNIHQKFQAVGFPTDFYFWWNEAARLHFTPFASCRISGNRKSSSLKKRSFSSHLHKISEALLVKSLHFIPLVKRSAPLPVKLPPFGGWMCYISQRTCGA